MPSTEMETELDERARLAAKYPQWHLWVSSANRPWATRLGKIIPPLESDHYKDPSWSMTIDADTWPELEEVLERQTQLDKGMLLRPRVTIVNLWLTMGNGDHAGFPGDYRKEFAIESRITGHERTSHLS